MKLSILGYSCAIFIVIALIVTFVTSRSSGGIMDSIFKPVSVASKIIADEELKSTDGRTNFLILGTDQRSAKSALSATLTDTIMVVSLGKTGTSTVLVSIPRDLWVPEISEKINGLYAITGMTAPECKYDKVSKDPETCTNIKITKIQKKVEEILGIPIHYHALVGLGAFTDAIDAVGGVTVTVDESFTDSQYPIEGREAAEPESSRYKIVRFTKGTVSLNGETALEFSRSRHADNPLEQGDFARARRQQKVITSLKEKLVSSDTFLNPAKVTELFNAINNNVKTDVGLPEILSAIKRIKTYETTNIQKIVFSNETLNEAMLGSGTLYVPSVEEREQKFSGKYVLAPLGGDYENIKSIVRKALFCTDPVSCK